MAGNMELIAKRSFPKAVLVTDRLDQVELLWVNISDSIIELN